MNYVNYEVRESSGERWLAGSGFRVTLGDVDINTLMSRGEEFTDLLVNIFEALGSVPDPSFQTYMERIKDDYDSNDEKVTADYRMSRCKIKC